MKKLVIVLISVSALLIVISGCEFFYDYLVSKTYLGDVKITLTMEDLSQELTFNQGPLSTDVEYAWRVFIDTDANALTGDGTGFEVQIELEFLSYNSYTNSNVATLATVLDDDIYDSIQLGKISWWDGSDWEQTGDCEVFLDGSTLYLGVYSTDPLFANLDPNYRTRFSTEYYDYIGAATEIDVLDTDITGNATGSDSAIDYAAFPFINIIEVEIEFP